MTYTIYALADPRDNEVRYIGSTINYKSRINQHLICHGNNKGKNAWVVELKNLGMKPVPMKLEEVECFPTIRESMWIGIYKEKGSKLFNMNDGGPGYRKGKTHNRLTEEDKKEILRLYRRGGYTQNTLGELFGVSGVAVHGILYDGGSRNIKAKFAQYLPNATKREKNIIMTRVRAGMTLDEALATPIADA